MLADHFENLLWSFGALIRRGSVLAGWSAIAGLVLCLFLVGGIFFVLLFGIHLVFIGWLRDRSAGTHPGGHYRLLGRILRRRLVSSCDSGAPSWLTCENYACQG